ncbi:endonuclease/exonuclease/phosphatase family protein [Kiloniella sp.]|uniref:endonuclease/exonuclease/phosphatase family protein n=1 Tax=Kiloniella sp. TaxID=1938587 RepID=UPI003B02EB7C
MTKILSWNIQCGLGIDNRVDLNRTAEVIKSFGDPDIICLQEVARFDPELDMGLGADQVAELSQLFPEHHPIFGAAINRWHNEENKRRQFGNMVLSRLPIIQTFNHLLPQPSPPTPCKHMPRQAVEIVVELPDGPLRITTTHLEYHCEEQRLAQIEHLRGLQADIISNKSYGLTAPESGPYSDFARPERNIICGDFNALVDDDVYRLLTARTLGGDNHYLDGWRVIYSGNDHDPTCGIHDADQWPEGPHCRDFFFLSRDLSAMVKKISVQKETDASDHQPILLELKTV